MMDVTGCGWTYDPPEDKRDFCVIRGSEGMVGVVYKEEEARLIAATPEMYNTLYEALQLLKGKSSWDGDEFSREAKDIQELLDRIDGKAREDEPSDEV